MHEKDTKNVCDKNCTTCRYEDRECNESPCVDCICGDGYAKMWEAKLENPLDGFLSIVMDADAWQEFKHGRFAVILKDRADFGKFMEQCEKRGITWASGHSATDYVPYPIALHNSKPIAVGRFSEPYEKIAYSQSVDAWRADNKRKYYLYGGERGETVENPEQPQIKDSGSRREFESGAVRDICEGKGRCDLLPLDVIGSVMNDSVITDIANFVFTRQTFYLSRIVKDVSGKMWKSEFDMVLDLAKHFEEGAKKYGERNWEKGLPVHCYIDSAVRHYLKWRRGDKDEPHDRAFVWNLTCCIWTMKHRPEMDDLPKRTEEKETGND